MALGPAKDETLEAGTELNGTYVVLRKLFEGGMGDIYEARHVRLTGRYAIKVLRRNLTGQHASAFDRFRREAEVTSSLRHPHIVQVLDFNQVPNGAAYFVMELLEGQNLRQFLMAHGPMPLPDVAVVVEQVASALQAVHERGIVHRDLKPENIHLVAIPGRQEPFVKVLDFGISKVLAASTLTQEAVLVGTPHYMAPEQARGGSEDLDGRTDQFALGAIVHELLTGRRVFESENVAAIIYQVLNEDPPSVANITGELVDAAIRRAMAKAREDRFPRVVDFADAIREAVFGPPRTRLPLTDTPSAYGSGRVLGGTTAVLAGAGTPTGSAPTLTSDILGARADAAPPRRRTTLWMAAALLGAAGAGAAVWSRRAQPIWQVADGDAIAIGAQLDRTVRRVLDEETARFSDVAARAGKVPQLANAITGRVDEATFQDLLANELWWADFRAFGCAVMVNDEVRVAWHLPTPPGVAPRPTTKPAIAGIMSTVGTAALNSGARAALVSDGTFGSALAALAPVDGVPGGRVVLTRPVDRALVADLAAHANTVLVLSNGQQLLGISVPDNTIPEIGLLPGREDARVLVDRRHGRLAAAVPWSRGLWVWGVMGWSS